MKMFYSEIDWQMDEFEVHVRVGAFATRSMADAFGQYPSRLEAAGEVLRLLDDDGRVLAEIGAQHTTVTSLKDEAKGKTCLSDEDYQAVEIPIADFHRHPALLNLEGISCGTFEGVGAPLGPLGLEWVKSQPE